MIYLPQPPPDDTPLCLLCGNPSESSECVECLGELEDLEELVATRPEGEWR